jgi:3-hydroxyacyl-CoA dehydrogenase/enoyl-CoA hydratase/3-hydroxybutyryl-CoA epimerase
MSTLTNIRRDTDANGLCVVTFDRPGSSANIFDRATMEELARHFEGIAGDPQVTGVVIRSAKPSIFIAGADLNALASLGDGELEAFIEFGQQTFNSLAALKVPTVAAIHGACVGGGYEIALACDYRVASPDKVTKIGLPETKLGILPAWGGSTRLPRLIGVRRALDVILGGKTPGARQALKLGMIDEVAPRESLMVAAMMLVRRGKRVRNASLIVEGWGARIMEPLINSQLRRKTRGNYPALELASEIIVRAASQPVERSLQQERSAVVNLARHSECRNQMRLFFQQEKAKKRAIHKETRDSVRRVESAVVIGAGVMGSAIAQWISSRGLKVMLKDIDASRVAAGMANIGRLYASGVKRKALTRLEARDGMDRVIPVVGDFPLQRIDLIVEAIVEKMELKKQVFGQLAGSVGTETILATNTSALSITEMAAALPDPSRLVGIHFFNPVHRMQLVEIVLGEKTSPEVAQRAVSFAQQIGKLPIVVRDRPGFLVNRILLPYLIEAGLLVERGAGITAIDEAMLDFGMPMGPLRLVDEIGVDVALDVATDLAKHFPDRLKVPAVLARLKDLGWLGKKTGRGFYVYGRTITPNPTLVGPWRKASSSDELRGDVATHLALLMVAEAARCLEEKIAETADDIDFAMVMGTGFAPFRGGPLRYADAMGAKQVSERMRRFGIPPVELIEQLAAKDQPFHET